MEGQRLCSSIYHIGLWARNLYRPFAVEGQLMILYIALIGIREIEKEAQRDVVRKGALGLDEQNLAVPHEDTEVVILASDQNILKGDNLNVGFRHGSIFRMEGLIELEGISRLTEEEGKDAVLAGVPR